VIVIDASSLAKIMLLEEGWDRIPLTIDPVALNYSIIEVSNSI